MSVLRSAAGKQPGRWPKILTRKSDHSVHPAAGQTLSLDSTLPMTHPVGFLTESPASIFAGKRNTMCET